MNSLTPSAAFMLRVPPPKQLLPDGLRYYSVSASTRHVSQSGVSAGSVAAAVFDELPLPPHIKRARTCWRGARRALLKDVDRVCGYALVKHAAPAWMTRGQNPLRAAEIAAGPRAPICQSVFKVSARSMHFNSNQKFIAR